MFDIFFVKDKNHAVVKDENLWDRPNKSNYLSYWIKVFLDNSQAHNETQLCQMQIQNHVESVQYELTITLLLIEKCNELFASESRMNITSVYKIMVPLLKEILKFLKQENFWNLANQ